MRAGWSEAGGAKSRSEKGGGFDEALVLTPGFYIGVRARTM